MTDTPEFHSVSPILLSRDVSRTADFYTEHLGFSIQTMYDGYVILRRGAVSLHFSRFDDLNPKENPCSVYIYVTAVGELFEQCKAEGVLHPNGWLRERHYGMRDFAVIDPDGNLLTFGERMKSE